MYCGAENESNQKTFLKAHVAEAATKDHRKTHVPESLLVALFEIRFGSLFFDVEKRRQCCEVTAIP